MNTPYYSNQCQANYFPYMQTSAPFYRMELNQTPDRTCISKAELELNQIFRTLWEQHVAWTRMLIISIAEGLSDEVLVTERLLRNPVDMAAVFRHY
ncbi:hypothetical protein, partial [Pseudomonas syringae]|uniref:hypothetical protein n=1 Tax=Pseudomonas syringae TaxID=317 RepID=UPI001C649A30